LQPLQAHRRGKRCIASVNLSGKADNRVPSQHPDIFRLACDTLGTLIFMSADTSLLTTPLHALHTELGAKMVPFAGYSMPVQYPMGLMAEHAHTRTAAGLFDVSHMGQLLLRGRDAAAAFESLMPVDVIDLAVGKQRYGLLTTDEGTIIDDLMFVNMGNDETSADRPPLGASAPSGGSDPRVAGERGGTIFVIVNGACKAGDIAHMQAKIGKRCEIITMPTQGLLALQGPMAVDALQRVVPGVDKLVFMTGTAFTWNGAQLFITRSGYTGEDGFEISVPEAHTDALARALLAQPEVKPIGLGARNSLRLEAGLCLYGQDIDTTTDPLEASLAWAIQKVRRGGGARAGGFPGDSKIIAACADNAGAIAQKTLRKRVGLIAQERVPVREGVELFIPNGSPDGTPVGKVTSGLLAPTINVPIAMGYVPTELSANGTLLHAMVRGKPVPMIVSSMPFVPNRYYRGPAP
jgi:aminomethyltransferase